MMQEPFIQISPFDNVAVALTDLEAGTICQLLNHTISLVDSIPFGHKFALTTIAENEPVIKYGQPIGHASCPIQAGQHIHVPNIKTNLGGILEYTYTPDTEVLMNSSTRKHAVFDGYVRENGKVGIRNEVWIIPTVGCVNSTAEILAKKAQERYPNQVDGIYAFPHNMGCSQMGEDQTRTQQLLKGLIQHPNAGAVLVLSLGCENNNLEVFKPMLGEFPEGRVQYLVTQDVEDEYETGLQLLKELIDYASTMKREPVSADKLVLGFKCGGSDAFSGITANALCGRINDQIVAHGGSTILTEVPEMFGAETLLMKRCVTREIFDDTVHLINDFKNYYVRYNQAIYENPSPGNKKGGISTLEEKSLGCTQKGGQAPVVGVLDYGETVTQNGLNLLIGPGNDQVSCTNLTASGAQMILFTTGRGNPFGAPAPTVKISSNSPLYHHKKHWIDYNAGQLLEGRSFDEVTDDFFKYLLDVASGKIITKNEQNEYREISLFRDGVIL